VVALENADAEGTARYYVAFSGGGDSEWAGREAVVEFLTEHVLHWRILPETTKRIATPFQDDVGKEVDGVPSGPDLAKP